MKNLTQKLSKRFFGVGVRVVTLALFLVVFGASAALAQTRGYVTNGGDNTVSVIDTATNTVVTNISVGNNPRRLAVDPTGTSVYVPQSSSSGSVTVINTATNVVTGTISTGAGSIAIAFPVPTQGPANKDQCKNGGWATFTNPEFKSEGQCIKFVNQMG